jgi:hypothetical protein
LFSCSILVEWWRWPLTTELPLSLAPQTPIISCLDHSRDRASTTNFHLNSPCSPPKLPRTIAQNSHHLDHTRFVPIACGVHRRPSSFTMSSAPRSGERMIHQDFIARIRFSNALPPPPHPPKLLDIPNTGLASGQYTTPGFASRLAREQPLNIEADAELGMPLDLVGMPGVFDGDERCAFDIWMSA